MTELTQPLPLATGADLARAARRVTARQLALPGLAALAGVLYLVNLTVSGWANTYYALAAQAASQSWSALFFGSLDASGFITLDKPPLAVLPMAIAVKLLGLSSFSILLPQALLGIATVVVLYLTVRRSFGEGAAFVAGLVAALTPVAVLIFRYDNPDALLTFLLVSAAWALGRGLERGRLRWALLAATLVGLAFLTKYLQAYVVLPAFALTWLVCAPGSLPRRIGGLLASGLTVLVASGWWVALVELIPAGSRPYIGGSNSNSVLELIFGYDGLGRIFGNTAGGSSLSSAIDGLAGGAAAGRGGPSFSGTPGLLRLFNDQLGGQIAWLLPAALLALGVLLVAWRRAGRTDRRVAGAVLWGGWLVTHVAVFSFMSGIIHSYYAVVMAPAIGALVGAGAAELWRAYVRTPASSGVRLEGGPGRTLGSALGGRLAGPFLAVGLAIGGVTAWLLLDRTPGFAPGLGVGILALSVATGLVLAIPHDLLDRRAARLAAALGLVVILAGPAAYSAATMASGHSGGDPAAGPSGDGMAGGGDATADTALVSYLVDNQGAARWIVAVSGSQSAAAIQLAAGQPVMAMGGFTGSDPAPTLEQLRAYVASGELRYVLVGGRFGAGAGPGLGTPPSGGFGAGGFGPGGVGPGGAGGPDAGSASVSTWVASACTAVTIDGSSVAGLYDCAGAA
ncbi:MAG TPA: glycosyltransferase family 39 protein [Candidatus Limnocylindrales bacterium]|nr:glycosyltransferase family 39 protein [Candidatus Limnocylindrales bacterium]